MDVKHAFRKIPIDPMVKAASAHVLIEGTMHPGYFEIRPGPCFFREILQSNNPPFHEVERAEVGSGVGA